MDRRVDLHRRAEQRLGTDLDARAVENDAAGVDVDAVAQMGVHAVGAAERRFDEDVAAEAAEQAGEALALRRVFERVGAVVGVDRLVRLAAQRLQLRRHDVVGQARHRSEEHTSELQSLMRSSYAVFCLKKNTYIY